MAYKNLEMWQLSRQLSIDIHKMTLKELPSFEMFEEGNQIRRSIKSVRSNIVEGYGRRQYAKDYIKFMIYAIASNDETTDHLETLFETSSLSNKIIYEDLHKRLEVLGKKLNLFIQRLELGNQKPETSNQQPETNNQQPETRNQKPETRNQQPVTSSQQPATRNQQPATSNQQPETRNQKPETRNQ